VKEVKKKENATRSGAGAVDYVMTPRITWLLENFEFVKSYVCQARATRGSTINKRRDQQSDCSESSATPQATLEGTPQSATTSATTGSISNYLDKVTQQLAEPKSDIEKTCDFLGVLMAKMTPSCPEEFTHEATCKAMEYVKQSNVERRQAQQPPQVTYLQPTFRLMQQANQAAAPQYASLKAPPEIATAPSRMVTTSRQPQQSQLTTDYIYLQPTAYSTPVRSGTQAVQAPATAAAFSTDTAEALGGAFQTMNANTSFNLSDYICPTPKNTDAQ